MPKDRITDITQPNWHAEVYWRGKPDGDDRGTAEGHVQLATVNLLSPFEFPDVDTGGHFKAGERFDGWRVTLDEAGIDRLIKALHKAKRQAFGQAEQFLRRVAPILRGAGYSDRQIAEVERAVSMRVPVEVGRGQLEEGGPLMPPRLSIGGVLIEPDRGEHDMREGDSLAALLSEGSGDLHIHVTGDAPNPEAVARLVTQAQRLAARRVPPTRR